MLNETKDKNHHSNFNHKAQVRLLSIEQMFNLNIGKFLLKFYNNQLPKIFRQYFTEIKQIHSYPKRLSCDKNYILPKYCLNSSEHFSN